MDVIYLYGFASGPESDKAQYFKEKFESIGQKIQIYDYISNSNEFSRMKISELYKNLCKYIATNFQKEKVILFGSSFGGLMVTLYAHFNPTKVHQLILMAPALQFTPDFISRTLGTTTATWENKGEVLVEHYRFLKSVPLKYSFLKDLLVNPIPLFSLNNFKIPTVIFHGKHDDVVPCEWSSSFAKSNPKVLTHILQGDHQLSDQKDIMWGIIEKEILPK